jgi:hypothetical protein
VRQALIASVVLACAAPAAAQTVPEAAPEAAAEEPPWARGVTAEQRAAAQRLLEDGNELFLRARHREALARYQEALASWDHPAIRFNIVRALIYLDRPVEAFENLELALRYGAAPLEEQVYAEAQGYQRLLRGRIAELAVRCAQPDVTITVDGKDFVRCPGSHAARLLPGTHQVVGKRAGYLTVTRDVVVMPGQRHDVDLRLPSLAEATTTERRWAPWKPWAVVGAGAVTAGLGVLLELQARRDYERYRGDLADLCSERPCSDADLPGATRDLADRARLEEGIAISAMAVGGAAIVGGVALVILNRPIAVLPESRALSLVPTVTPDGVGASVAGRF